MYIEFPYLEDLNETEYNNLKKEDNWIVCDPGKRDLLYMKNKNGDCLRYSNKQHLKKTKRFKYQRLIQNYKNLNGIYNLASNPISKFELLHLINSNFDLGLVINKDQNIVSNKTLDASKIENKLGVKSPSWNELIIELKKDYMHFIDLYKRD